MLLAPVLILAVYLPCQAGTDPPASSDQGPRDLEALGLYEELAAWLDEAREVGELEAIGLELERLEDMARSEDAYWVGQLWMEYAERAGDHHVALEVRIEAYRAARRTFLAAGSYRDAPELAVWALQNLGSMLQGATRYDEAASAMEEALAAYREMGNAEGVAEVEFNLANLAYQSGRPSEAIARIQRALPYFRANPGVNLLNCLNSLASFHLRIDQLTESAFVAEELIASATALENWLYVGYAHEKIGWTLQSSGRYEEALAEFRSAQGFYRKAGSAYHADKSAGNLAASLTTLRRFDEAQEAYERALGVITPDTDPGNWLNLRFNQADMFADMGDLERARAGYGELLEIARSARDAWLEADLLQNLAGLDADEGSLERACRRLKEARALRSSLGDRLAPAEIEEGLGNVYSRLGGGEDALTSYGSAARQLAALMRSQLEPLSGALSFSVRKQFRGTYDGAMRVLAELEPTPEQLAEAYAVPQTFHGATINAQLAETRAALTQRIPDHLGDRYARLLDDYEEASTERLRTAGALALAELDPHRGVSVEAAALTRLDQRVVELEGQLARIEERIRATDPVYASIQYPSPASLESVQACLPERAALLEYVWTTDAVYAFALTRGGASFRRLASAEGAQDLVQRLRDEIEAGGDGAVATEAGRLLVDPILPAGVERLWIAPDGELCFVPFEALHVGDDGRYLVETHDVAYVHSGTVLRDTAGTGMPEHGAGLRLVAIGDPRWDREATFLSAERSGPGALPGTAIESLELAAHLSGEEAHRERLIEVLRALREDPHALPAEPLVGGGTVVRLGALATEDFVRTDPAVRAADVLLFACHGEADFAIPSQSRLYLAPGAEEDGFLTLRELGGLDLSARLVVLSACESNLGELRAFEGLTGLALAARQAGARSVLSTLWKVDDDDSLALMRDFFSGWARRGEPLARALAEAKRAAIADRHVPRSWAGYLLWDTSR